MSYDVFISHSSKDKTIADAIVSALENSGIRCWVAPRDIEPGADWGDSITEAISQCASLVLIFSNNANQSKRVLDEIYFAISEEKPILPFRIEKLDPTGAMRLHLSSRHWLDAYSPSWESHIDQLVQSVSGTLGRQREGEGRTDESRPVGGVKKQRAKGIPWKWIGLFAGVLAVIAIVYGFLSWGKRGQQTAALQTPTEDQVVMPTASLEVMDTATVMPTKTTVPTVTMEPEVEQEAVLNLFYVYKGWFFDPENSGGIIDASNITENLFLNLTNYDINSKEMIPEAAESWTMSTDGRHYTFKLRTDIPWVVHTPDGETVQVLDEDGEQRFLTAHDFVYAIWRVCDPNSYSGQFIGEIAGCEEVNAYDEPANIPLSLFEAIGVQALADDELFIELVEPAGYFLFQTSMTFLSAVPQWAVEKYGDAWTSPGLMPTNGYFVIDEFEPGGGLRLVRNPLLPEDMAGSGNVDVIEITVGQDIEEGYALWRENQVDFTKVPPDELLSHRVQYSTETTQVFEQTLSLLEYQQIGEPFDNAHARRAFSTAFDATYYVNEVVDGQGLPMIHTGIPTVIGAPPIDEVGVGYDPVYAREQLALAGYPDCNGLPEIRVWAFQSGNFPGAFLPDHMLRKWEQDLGCPEGIITAVFTEGEVQESPIDIVLYGWSSYIPDEANWVGGLASCNSFFIPGGNCDQVDEWIEQAKLEVLPDVRTELYRQIEDALFGYDGKFTIRPVFWHGYFFGEHTWLKRTDSYTGHDAYYNWTIDMEAKLAAQGK